MEIKIVILIIASIILLLASSSISIYIYSKQCNELTKCVDPSGKCVDIPQYHSRSSNGKCKLECLDDNVCIKNNLCIPIPDDSEKNYDDNKCQKIITYAPETTMPVTTPTATPAATINEDETLPNDVYLVGTWKIDFRNNKLSITKNTDLPEEDSVDMKTVKGFIFKKSNTGSLLINKV